MEIALHSFLFHLGDYYAHTAHLTPMEDLAYRRLIDLYYLHQHPPRGTPEELARVIRLREEVSAVEQVLREFFREQDGAWENKRCAAEVAKYKAMATAGKRGADKRWGGDSPPIAPPLPPHSPPNGNHEPLTVNHEPLKEKSARGTRFSLAALPDEWQAFCRAERPDLHPVQTFAAFGDYWKAIPGQKGSKLDWDATWRNWVRGARKQSALDALAERKAKGDAALAVMTGKVRRMSDANVIDMEAQNDLLRAIAGDSIQQLPSRN